MKTLLAFSDVHGILQNAEKLLSTEKYDLAVFLGDWGNKDRSILEKYNVISIAVNSKSNENIIEYMKKNNLHFNTINDENGALSKKFKIKAFPTILIYDKNKNLIFTEVGYTSYIGLLLRMIWI